MAINVSGDDFGLFWHSKNGDRKYSPDSFESWLKKFFTTGVFDSDLQVTATSGMGISVASGYANVEGKIRVFKSATTFTLTAADADYPRIDTVVVERNESDRNIYIKVVEGEPAQTPVAVAPVRADGVYQLVLAQILVGAAVSSISQSNITDTRMSSTLCGWVSSTIDEINYDQAMSQFTTWFNEYKEEIIEDFSEAGEMAQIIFNAWFNTIKDKLTEDVAGSLQLEIDSINEIIADAYSPIELYNIGEYVTYENKLYKCTTTVTEYGEFDADYWEEVPIDDKINSLTPKRIVAEHILSVTSWDNGEYDLSGTYPNNVYDIQIAPHINMTEEQLKAYGKAKMVGSSTNNTIYALGKIPTIAINVMITAIEKKEV